MTDDTWVGLANQVWRSIVRPIAIGGMLMSAGYTLYRMRKSLGAGLSRAIKDVKKAASGTAHVETRTEKDMNYKWVFLGIGASFNRLHFSFTIIFQVIFRLQLLLPS